MTALTLYSAIEQSRDGRQVEIRALRSEDRDDMLAAIARTGTQSLQRRFFGAKRRFSEQEVAFFTNIDLVNHVGLVAVVEEDGKPRIVGGARYVVVRPAQAELAFLVIDSYQHQGIGALLLKHLVAIARRAGLQKLDAEVLAENAPMLKLFKRSGFEAESAASGVIHLTKALGT